MKDEDRSRDDVFAELRRLRSRVAELESGTGGRDHAVGSLEHQYHELIQENRDGYARLNMDGSFVLCNPAFCAMLGYPQEELRSKAYADITPDRWRATDEASMKQMLEEGSCDCYEKEYRRRDGTIFPVELQSYLVRDADGNATGMWSFVRDITDRKASEASIARLNRIYALLRGANTMIVRCQDRQSLLDDVCGLAVDVGGFAAAWVGAADHGGVVKVAACAGVTQGYIERIRVSSKPDQVSGRGPMGVAIREGRRTVCNDIAQEEWFVPWQKAALKQGYQAVAVFPLVCEENTIAGLALYSHTPFFFDKDELALLDELAADISFALSLLEQRQRMRAADAALREREEEYRLLMEHLPVGIIVHALDTRITYANPMAERLLGLSADQIRGMSAVDPVWRFLREDGSHTVPDDYPVNKVLTTGKPLQGSVLGIARRDGSVLFWVLCNAYPVSTPGGVISEVVVTFVDITEERSREHSLQEARARLLESEKFAAIGRVSSGIAHEINNPLAAIRSSTELMRRALVGDVDGMPELTPRLIERIDKVLRNVDRCKGIVESLLGYARRGTGDYQPVDIVRTLQAALSVVRESAGDAGCRIVRSAMTPTLERLLAVSEAGGEMEQPWADDAEMSFAVRARPGQFEQVFQNLLMNALYATTAGGSVFVSYRTVDGGIEVTVADTGEGVAEQDIPRVFEPFFTTKHPGEGTGLGLYMTRRIVESAGGRIDCESVKDRGTLIRVWLPGLSEIRSVESG